MARAAIRSTGGLSSTVPRRFGKRAAKAHAFLRGRAYAIPDDVKAIARDVLRHRLLLTYEAEAEAVDPDALLTRLLERIDVP